MVALLKNAEDGTLISTKVETAYYNNEEKELYLSGNNYDFTIMGIDRYDAYDHIRKLYEDGRTDLTQYKASFDEDNE